MNAQERRRIIQETNLCLNPNCTAHDKQVEAILRLEAAARERGRAAVYDENLVVGPYYDDY